MSGYLYKVVRSKLDDSFRIAIETAIRTQKNGKASTARSSNN
jgi:hypothetical protein